MLLVLGESSSNSSYEDEYVYNLPEQQPYKEYYP